MSAYVAMLMTAAKFFHLAFAFVVVVAAAGLGWDMSLSEWDRTLDNL